MCLKTILKKQSFRLLFLSLSCQIFWTFCFMFLDILFCRLYYPNGNINAKGPTDANFKKIGDWIYYSKDGTPEKIVTFRNGNKVSEKKYKK